MKTKNFNLMTINKLKALTFKNILVIITIFAIILLNLLFTELSNLQNEECNLTVSSLFLENKKLDIELINKDYYFIPEFSNVFCIGKVVHLPDFSIDKIVKIGSNPKFVYLFFALLSFFYIFLIFISKLKIFKKLQFFWEDYLISYTIFYVFLSSYFYGIFKLDFYIISLLPVVILQSVLTKNEAFKYTKFKDSSTYTKITFTFSIILVFFLFETLGIYSLNNKNSWQVILIIYILSSRFTNEEKIVVYLFTVLSVYFNLALSLIAIILFLNLSYFEIKIKYKEIFAVFFLLPVYIYFRFEELSLHFTIDPDHFVWVFTALRMEALDLGVFHATLESKGVLFLFIYYGITLFTSIMKISIWKGIAVAYLLLSWILFIFFLKFNKSNYKESRLNLIIALLFLLDLTNDERLKFDARFIGSFFIFFGIYYLLIKKNDYIGGIFLGMSLFSLLTFGLPVALLSIYLVIYKKRIKILYGQISVLLIVFIYLIITNQLYQAFIMNFKIYFGSQYPYSKTPLIDIVNRNPFLYISIFTLIIFIFSIWKKIINKEIIYICFIWFISEFIHLYLTGPRFEHYSILLLIPSYLILNLLSNEIFENNYLMNNSKITNTALTLIALLFSFSILHSNYFPYHKNFPNEIYGSNVSLSSTKLNVNKEKIYSIYNLPDFKYHKNYDYGIYVSYSPNVFLEYFENKNIIPAGSGWQIVWHLKDFINYDFFFSDKYFYDDLFYDYEFEMPKYAIVEQAMVDKLRNNLLTDYIYKNFDKVSCDDEICLYINN